jgi:hypothetical protein
MSQPDAASWIAMLAPMPAVRPAPVTSDTGRDEISVVTVTKT